MTRPEFSAIIARLIPRIETELARLGLDDATIRGVTPHIVRKVRALGIDSTSAADRFLAPDSSFFRFWEKIEKVAGHYDSYGLTHAAYLKAALKQPSLFTRSPAAVVRHVDAVAEYLGRHGIGTRAYLRAALRVPSLLCLDAGTVIGNIEAVCDRFAGRGLDAYQWVTTCLRQPVLMALAPETLVGAVDRFVAAHDAYGLTHPRFFRLVGRQPSLLTHSAETVRGNCADVAAAFAAHGLTVEAYTRAALRQPSLFCITAAAVVKNVRELARHVAGDGVQIDQVVRACLKAPALFYLDPARVCGNLSCMADELAAVGMTRSQVVGAAVRYPQLFYMLPETVGRHAARIDAMYRGGQFRLRPSRRPRPPGEASDPAAALARFLASNPRVLLLDDTNYELRGEYQRLLGRPLSSQLLLASRQSIEAEVMRLLGHDDPAAPVPPSASPELLGMIGAGLIKSASVGGGTYPGPPAR
jgi:hypothetical protein